MKKLLLLCFLSFAVANANAALTTISPKQGAIQSSFTELAKTRLAAVYDINMPLSGKLKRVTLKEGGQVKQGEIVAQLVEKPWRESVAEVKGQLATFQEWYALREKILQRDLILYKKGFFTEQNLDKSRSYTKMLQAEIASDQAKLATAKYNLTKVTIYAPINGIVLERYSEGGTWMAEGTQLLQIGNLSDLDIICDVLTQDAQKLKIGDPVLLSSIGSEKVLSGKVARIYPAGFTKKSSLGVDEQRVNVIVKLNKPEAANLGVGYRLQAKFLVGTAKKNALIVPRFSVLQDKDGQYYVFVVKDKKLQKQTIKIGIKTDTQISVISGITAHDKIIAQPTADMHDGMKV
ncbi:MAG: efflux RND transporter periplasmic adaptor subunit [Gammaproteobacteria bacterium]|nr:efflux RND transporter periplasmic adaptor subunit [Gammaproteobacteria bacterium]